MSGKAHYDIVYLITPFSVGFPLMKLITWPAQYEYSYRHDMYEER
jgi:hypothetical protein